jgi:hypothetical protein
VANSRSWPARLERTTGRSQGHGVDAQRHDRRLAVQRVWFCETVSTHAWPVKYMIGVDAPIVGLGTIDQNVMVLIGSALRGIRCHPR